MAKSKTKAKSNSKPNSKSEPNSKSKSNSNAKAGAKANLKTASASKSGSKAASKTQAKSPASKSSKSSTKKPASGKLESLKKSVLSVVKKTIGAKTSAKLAEKLTPSKGSKDETKGKDKKAKPAQAKKSAESSGRVLQMSEAREKKNAGVAISKLFTPLDDRIVVERTTAADRTPGGIFIPDSVTERPNQGKVVAVGRGHLDRKGRLRPLDVKVGDVVMFSPWTGSDIKMQGSELLVLHEKDIIAIVAP